MNLVILKGNLTRDPETRVVETAKRKTTVTNFTLAISRHFKKADGTPDKDVLFVNCEAWDTGAETLAKYLVKGSPLLVEGSLKEESWADKETGEKRSRIKVRVSNFDFLGGRSKTDAGQPESAEQPAEQPTEPVAAGADSPF